MSTVIGIDPGQQCGLAVFSHGMLTNVLTLAPHELMKWLREFVNEVHGMGEMADGLPFVVFEDSRLQSHVWNATGKRGSLRIARNLGMVDGICAQLQGWCEGEDVDYIAVSPKGKGRKMDTAAFKFLTGWAKRTNQHERDAALVAWPYRSTKPARRAGQ